VNSVLESERLRECLEAAQATLRAAEEEAETIRAQLVDADGRVAGKFFLVTVAPFFLVRPFSDACVLLSELETEL
jgi:hypothetical protein